MGLFDGVFNTGPQNAAANAQVGGIQSGLQGLQGAINQGSNYLGSTEQSAVNSLQGTSNAAGGAAQTNYMAALAPYLQNFAQAQQGTTALGNALGLNGAAGNAAAIQAFQNNPGYQFGLQQGENAIAAQAQAAGMGASGNALNAADQFAQNYANQNWNQYIANLNPYLGQANTAAAGIGNTYTGLGNNLSANLLSTGQNVANSAQTLGQNLNQNQNTIGNAIYGADSSIGNAYANAQLAQAGANANAFNFAGNLANLGTKIASISDESMKEEIERVGELYDGQPVYRYRMKGDPRHQIGLIAQEVEGFTPDAVMQFTPHVKGVDYKRATEQAATIFRMMGGT